MQNIFTVDVEDWEDRLAFSKEYKQKKPSRTAVAGVKKILAMLKKYKYTATFFVLGSVAERYPDMVKQIVREGHEVASHGYSHKPLNELTPQAFDEELEKTEKIFMKLTGKKPVGFRAPKFSLSQHTAWAIKVLKKRGYQYDSSLFPAKLPFFGYGKNTYPVHPCKISENNIEKPSSEGIHEFPVVVWKAGMLRVPLKVRHFGSAATHLSVKALNKKKSPATVVIHTWEVVPKPKGLPRSALFKEKIRNFRIPMDGVIERLFNDHKFMSIQKWREVHE